MLLAIVVAIVVGFAFLVTWAITQSRGPLDATNRFVAMVDDGRLDEAYESLCTETRQAFTFEDFVDHMEPDGFITGYTFVSAAVRSGGETMVSGTIEVNDVPQAVDFGVIERGDTWQVCTYPVLDRP